jgi:hypothetical protein
MIEIGLTPLTKNATSTNFHLRGCVETGAPQTVCGQFAAQELCSRLGIDFRLSTSAKRFKFADQMSASLGSLRVPIETPEGIQDLVEEVADASIPLLLGLDFMDRIGATPNTLTNRLESKHG